MSLVKSLREFISERLTSAVDEIFTEVEKTIVQYEEVIDRQRRLLDFTLKPQISLTRTDPPQRHVLNEKEIQNDQQISNQDRESNLDQEEPAEPIKIKVDQEEPADPLRFKVDQDEPVELLQIKVEQVEREEPGNGLKGEEPEPNLHLLLPPGSVTTETPGQEEAMQPDSDVEMPTMRLDSDMRYDDSSETSFNFENGDIYFKSRFPREQATAAEHVCLRCGKAFRRRDSLLVHVKSHMGQYAFTCEVCGRGFVQRCGLMNHIKIHSDDRPYTCRACGKGFRSRTAVMAHMRSHQVQKMFQSKRW